MYMYVTLWPGYMYKSKATLCHSLVYVYKSKAILCHSLVYVYKSKAALCHSLVYMYVTLWPVYMYQIKATLSLVSLMLCFCLIMVYFSRTDR